MSNGIITITKQLGANRWTNVHAVSMDSGLGSLTVADLITLGVQEPFNEDTTNLAAEPGSLAGTYFLHSLIAFERAIHGSVIDIVRIYVSDGIENAPGEGSVFFAADFQAPCLAALGAQNSIVPGPLVLQVNKQPALLAIRTGRSFFRGVLNDGDISLGGPKLVEFATTSAFDSTVARFNNAIVDSALEDYLTVGAAPPPIAYAIPQYQGRCEANPGWLKNAVPVTSIDVVRPAARQTTRGKKRTTPDACPT